MKSWYFDSLSILQPESGPHKEVFERLEMKIFFSKLVILRNACLYEIGEMENKCLLDFNL